MKKTTPEYHQTSIRIPTPLKLFLEAMAKESHRSRNGMLNHMIRMWIAERYPGQTIEEVIESLKPTPDTDQGDK
jgi:predicted DNA-binding protein